MSYHTSVYTACEDLQGRMSNVWGMGTDPQLRRDPSVFLEWLLSPANVNGINQTVNPGNGKTRTVNLIYDQPYLESQVLSVGDRDCRTGDPDGDKVETYEIDTTDILEWKQSFKLADLTRKCEENPDFIARRMLMGMIAVDQAAATKIAGQAAALAGEWSTDVETAMTVTSDELIVETKDAQGNLKGGALEEIQWAAQASGFGSFVGFGGQLLDQHFRLSLAGCCAKWGVHIGELLNQYGFAFGYDRRLATALGSVTANNLIADVGALQVLHYTENEGLNGIESFNLAAGNFYGTAVTPAGIPVDVTIKDECKTFTIQIQANVKLVGLPTDMYRTGSNFEGVNGVALVKVTNPSGQ